MLDCTAQHWERWRVVVQSSISTPIEVITTVNAKTKNTMGWPNKRSSRLATATTVTATYRRLLIAVSIASCWRLPSIAASEAAGSKKCERLQDTLTYTQEEAPRDLSSVVRTVQCNIWFWFWTMVANIIPCHAIQCHSNHCYFLSVEHPLDPILSFHIRSAASVFLLLYNLTAYHIARACLASGSCGKNKPLAWRSRWRRSGMDGCRIARPSRWAHYRNHCHPPHRQ